MIDLCIDARMAFSSGIGTYIRQLIPFFNRPPFRLTLLVDRPGQAWCKSLEQIVFSAPIYSIREQILYPLKIPRCDLFWSPHYNVPILPIKAKKRIVTIHDACHIALGSFAEKSYAKFVMRRALHRSNRTITVSEFSKGEIQKYLGQKHVDVIPIAVNQAQFKKGKDLNNKVRLKYRLPEKFVLFVGNLKPHKNFLGLIKAFSKASLAGCGLVLAGKGKPIEGVLSIGQVAEEEIAILYSMAQMLVLPSFYEGFGLPPLEAMSCGCPTVVSNAASIPEVCGDASLYFDPENIDEMAKAIVQVARDEALRKILIQKGYERMKMFTWAKTAERHRALFEEVHRA